MSQPPAIIARQDPDARRKMWADALPKVSGLIEAIEQHGTGRRRSPPVERNAEDYQLQDRRRLVGSALGRVLHRNVAMFRGMMGQFEVSVVGAPGPRLQPAPPQASESTGISPATADEYAAWTSAATTWFREWAKWCDGSDDTPFAELVSQALTAGKREGDVLWAFDDYDRDDGTLRVYEADQMPTVAAKEWEKAARKDRRLFPWKEPNPDYERGKGVPLNIAMIQSNGVVRDRRGRVHGYIVSAEHGTSLVKWSEVSVLAAWNLKRHPTGSAKLYKAQWRKSYRGSAEATVFSAFQHDIYEMVSHALQSAKRAHTMAGWTETDISSGLDPVEQALLRSNIDPEKVLALAKAQSTEGTTAEVENLSELLVNRNYENFEKLTGGYWEYPNAGEKLHLESSDQPSQSIEPFANWLQGASGYSLGLGRSRALGYAATAYTAFRGEELMSWARFYWDQKGLERRLLDFAVCKAIGWAARMGEIPPAPVPMRAWLQWFRWDWPKMPEVDVAKAATAERTQQKIGKLSFADMLGPDWEAKLRALADQVRLARELELPLAILETVSGSVIEDPPGDPATDDGSQPNE